VIDQKGQQIGILPLEEAIGRAEAAGLDLVEIVPSAEPPVCRIADGGKLKFEEEKRARELRRKRHVSEVKEIRLRPRTDEHDLQVRIRAARRFLEEGHKVRHMWYTQVARATGARSTPQIGYVSQARRESGFLILSV